MTEFFFKFNKVGMASRLILWLAVAGAVCRDFDDVERDLCDRYAPGSPAALAPRAWERQEQRAGDTNATVHSGSGETFLPGRGEGGVVCSNSCFPGAATAMQGPVPPTL